MTRGCKKFLRFFLFFRGFKIMLKNRKIIHFKFFQDNKVTLPNLILFFYFFTSENPKYWIFSTFEHNFEILKSKKKKFAKTFLFVLCGPQWHIIAKKIDFFATFQTKFRNWNFNLRRSGGSWIRVKWETSNLYHVQFSTFRNFFSLPFFNFRKNPKIETSLSNTLPNLLKSMAEEVDLNVNFVQLCLKTPDVKSPSPFRN